jgi:hypothetical protein
MPKIPKVCRQFGRAAFDKRLQVAKSFIEKFVERVATSKSVDDSDGAWTQSIRRRFFEICPEDCYPLPDAPWNKRGQFLADVTWAEVDKEKRLLLACEIEWGAGWYGRTLWSLVEQGFEKLLPAKAPFKVFIFSSDYTLKGPKRTAKGDFSIGFAKEKLKASLENYGHHIPGEVYIFIDFPQTRKPDGDGKYQSFIWVAKKFGKNEVKLEKGPDGDLIRP